MTDELINYKDEYGGVLLGASSLTGRYWLGSLWFYQNPNNAPDVEKCTAGVQLEAGLTDARWIDNTKVIVGLDTGGIEIWELIENYHTFVHVHSSLEHDNIISSVHLSCDNKRAVSCGYDKCIKVWDVETLSSVHSFRGHYDIVECVRCHPLEPSMFLSCSQDNRILLWDTRKPRPASVVGMFPIERKFLPSIVDSSPLENSPRSLAWQPQSKNMFAVGSSTGQIVFKDTRTSIGTPLSFTPHTRDVYKLEFCSNRPQLLASVSEDCTTVVTSLDTQKQVYRDCSHKDYVRGVSWMNDLQLYTCGWDSQVKLNNVVHLLSNKKESAENSVQMDVNGGSDDNSNAKQSTKEVKCNGNGVTIETGATDTKLDTT
ncbi:methylosome protein 50 [Mytilus galloprovincialis]|uniref:Methylosome protein 50 n=1 Tax=Mytilus galloprovincialis TaxID=29158 RepID=A0A8B6HMV6_MYTGA|nr:methylosome protein 50 [Mytilus galloprovincialis]